MADAHLFLPRERNSEAARFDSLLTHARVSTLFPTMKTHASPRIEPLEPRIAPAGLIAVSVSGGTLQLKTVAGQDGDEVVTVAAQLDGTYLLTPGAGVTLRIGGADFATPQAVGPVTKGLVADLGTGNDELNITSADFSGAVTVKLGAGNDVLTIAEARVGGALNVTGAEGNDTINLQGARVAIGGLFTASLGAGNDVLAGVASFLRFGGGLKIDTGADTDAVTLGDTDDNVTIHGNAIFLGGDGPQTLSLGAASDDFTVQGALQLNLRGGDDTVTLTADQTSLGSASFTFGDGNKTVDLGLVDKRFSVRKDFKVSAGVGTHSIDLLGATASFGSVQFAFADSSPTVRFAAEVMDIRGDLRWKSGDGNASFTTRNNEAFVIPDALLIGGNVTAVMGDGTSFFNPDPNFELVIGGKVNVRAGDAPAPGGRLLFNSNFVNIVGSVMLSAGDNSEAVGVFGGGEFHLGGNVTLLAGTGNPTLDLTSNAPSTILGNVVMKTTATDGLIRHSVGQGSFIRGSETIQGTDLIFYQPSGLILGAVKVATAPGIAGAITFAPNSGTSRFAKSVEITLPTAGATTGTLNVANSVFESSLKIRGGAGNDTVNINAVGVLGPAFIDSGAGNDNVLLETLSNAGAATFRAPVRILAGAGADVVTLSSSASANQLLQFLASVIVDGGADADTDTLNIGGTTTFAVPGDPKQLNFP